MTNMLIKVFNWSEVHLSYKIHTLIKVLGISMHQKTVQLFCAVSNGTIQVHITSSNFDDLQYLNHQRGGWVGLKSQKHDDVILEWSLIHYIFFQNSNIYPDHFIVPIIQGAEPSDIWVENMYTRLMPKTSMS